MRLASIFFLSILFFSNTGYSQYKVSGTTMDTLNFMALQSASVVVIRNSDSMIAAHARTGVDGKFSLQAPSNGKYTLRISFPGYAEYIDKITVNDANTDLGTIAMITKQHLLNEVIITKQIAAIKIKGDTTEYMADSFKVKEGATVEDLLKKLPGLQVDKNGKITAQGEAVAKILVDGEEFFSDDPKVVTNGLQADAVKKVQVFDKKSDQAEFTGIDDGQKTKTINLELKDSRRKGYFGKIDAAGGTDGYFQNQGMINAFKGKRQLSVFAIVSNTDKVGLGWNDNDKYSNGNGTTEISDDGSVYTTYSSSDRDFAGWDGKYNGDGFPKIWTSGVHYADKWNEEKDHLVANYRYALQNVDVTGKTESQYILPNDSGFTQTQNSYQFSKSDKNALDVMFERKIDTNTSIKLSLTGGNRHMETSSFFNTVTLSSENTAINQNTRNIKSKSGGDFVNVQFLLKKKFKKKGRTLSFDFKENYHNNSSDGYLNSLVTVPTTVAVDSTRIDQEKKSSSNTLSFYGKLNYTEPLSKVAFLDMNYSGTINNSQASNFSLNKNGTGTYADTDLVYSSNYKYNVMINRGGLNAKFVLKNLKFNFGTDISSTQLQQMDLLKPDSSRNRNYFNIYPSASFNYKFSKQTSFNINYAGSTQQPTIDQIAPLRQNSDPLNITLGNPALKQAFNNRISLNFNDYKVLTGRYIWSYMSFNTEQDAISTWQKTSSTGNVTQYINVNGNYSAYMALGGGVKIKKTNFYVGGRLNSQLSKYKNKINDTFNVNNNNSYSASLDINYDKEAKYNFGISPEYTYNDNKATISRFPTSYYVFSTDFSGYYKLPKKFEVGSDANVMIRQKTTVFNTNNNVIKWNAWVGKKFLKNGQLEIKAVVNDILNQNIGFSRVANDGIITQKNYTTIRRYGMLELVWNFTHTPKAAGGDTETK